MDSSRSKCSKVQREHELLMIEKSETIKELQERLEATQKRLAQNISETSSQGYVNIKAMHERFKMDQEKYANDLLTYQGELDDLRAALKRKVRFYLGTFINDVMQKIKKFWSLFNAN